MIKTNPPHLIRLAEVLKMTSLGKSTAYKYINAGTFPKSISLGARSVRWIESEIEEWIDDRIKQRDQMIA